MYSLLVSKCFGVGNPHVAFEKPGEIVLENGGGSGQPANITTTFLSWQNEIGLPEGVVDQGPGRWTTQHGNATWQWKVHVTVTFTIGNSIDIPSIL